MGVKLVWECWDRPGEVNLALIVDHLGVGVLVLDLRPPRQPPRTERFATFTEALVRIEELGVQPPSHTEVALGVLQGDSLVEDIE
jgi:hypothetical protein